MNDVEAIGGTDPVSLSWDSNPSRIIINIHTGEVCGELQVKRLIDAFDKFGNKAKYKLVPVKEYLASLNNKEVST